MGIVKAKNLTFEYIRRDEDGNVEGKVHLKPLISKTFAFKDYLKAYQYIDDNRETTMKVIINVSEK